MQQLVRRKLVQEDHLSLPKVVWLDQFWQPYVFRVAQTGPGVETVNCLLKIVYCMMKIYDIWQIWSTWETGPGHFGYRQKCSDIGGKEDYSGKRHYI